MRDYGKVLPRFWTGNTGRALRNDRDAQVVALYLITGGHANMIGLYYLPIAYITADTGIPLEGASKALRRLSEEGFCRYDEGAEVVWVMEMARLQVGAQLERTDNRCKWIQKEYENLPHNKLLGEFFDKYAGSFHLTGRRGNQEQTQAPSKPLRSQKQEQKQEQEQEQPSDSNESAKQQIFKQGVGLLSKAGVEEKQARSFLGKLCRDHGDAAVQRALRDAMEANPVDPVPWLQRAVNGSGRKRGAADVGLAAKNYDAGLPRATGAA